jgi:D-inositol-3-phosphate glycosyltransferase
MKICLVAELYPPNLGGAELALSKIAEGLVARGIDVTVVTSRFDRSLPAKEQQGKLKIVRAPVFPFLKRFWFILSSLPLIWSHARTCDVIQGNTFAGAVPASLMGFLLGKKRVLLAFEVIGRQWFRFEPSRLRSTFYWLTERIIVRLPFHRCIAVSNHTKRTLVSAGVQERKIEVIYLGDSRIEQQAFNRDVARAELGFDPSDYVYLVTGRAGVTKGLEYLVNAIPEIAKRVPAARFLLIFSKYDSRIWRKILGGLSDLPSSLHKLVPPVPRVMLSRYYSAADCIVIPSLSEGFGFSALEACNANKVVVTTDAGSLPEVVFGKHVFVKPGSAEALAEGCVKANAGETSFLPPREFSWERTVDQLVRVYELLVSGRENAG